MFEARSFHDKYECLRKMVRLWEHLAKRPHDAKVMAYMDLGLEEDTNFCPLCEYVSDFARNPDDSLKCQFCLFRGVWPSESKEIDAPATPCTFQGSLYLTWLLSKDLKERSKLANDMVTASALLLNKLMDEDNK